MININRLKQLAGLKPARMLRESVDSLPLESSDSHPVNMIKEVIQELGLGAGQSIDDVEMAVAKEYPALSQDPRFSQWVEQAYNSTDAGFGNTMQETSYSGINEYSDFDAGFDIGGDSDIETDDYVNNYGSDYANDYTSDYSDGLGYNDDSLYAQSDLGDFDQDDEWDDFDDTDYDLDNSWDDEFDLELLEALPPKAMSALRTARDNIAKASAPAPAPAAADSRAPYNVPGRSSSSPEDWLRAIAGNAGKKVPDAILNPDAPPPPKPTHRELLDKIEVINQLLPIKKQIEDLKPKAEKWGPLPPGIRSDLDDSFIKSDDYQALLDYNRTALARLKQYIDTKRAVYRKKTVRENTQSEFAKKYPKTTGDLSNGYRTRFANGQDYFPDGADGPVTTKTGAAGARQGDNPSQKAVEISETYKQLVKSYRKFLSGSR